MNFAKINKICNTCYENQTFNDYYNITSVSNIWSVLYPISKSYETQYSKFIAWLLSPQETHGLTTSIVSDIYKHFKKTHLISYYSHASIEANKSNIDILFIDEINKHLIVIETKMKSIDHYSSGGIHQLDKYYIKIKETYPTYEKLFIYLTLNGDEPTFEYEELVWNTMSYTELYTLLKPYNNLDIISDFINDIRRHICYYNLKYIPEIQQLLSNYKEFKAYAKTYINDKKLGVLYNIITTLYNKRRTDEQFSGAQIMRTLFDQICDKPIFSESTYQIGSEPKGFRLRQLSRFSNVNQIKLSDRLGLSIYLINSNLNTNDNKIITIKYTKGIISIYHNKKNKIYKINSETFNVYDLIINKIKDILS